MSAKTSSSVSLVIPTYNRRDMWEQGALLRTIMAQSVCPKEVLVCDDGSTDGQLDPIRAELLNTPLPFEARLFRVNRDRHLDGGGPGVAENVLFREAAGEVILHADDDGMLDRKLVEYVEGLAVSQRPAVYWGKLSFLDPVSHETLSHADSRSAAYPRFPGVYKLRKTGHDAWGALWAAPTRVIRELGGHGTADCAYRGNDSRLGHRLGYVLPSYYATERAMTFRHFGIPTQYGMLHQPVSSLSGQEAREARQQAALQVKRFRETHRMPQLGNWRPEVTVNGGAAFWNSVWFDGLYEQIKA